MGLNDRMPFAHAPHFDKLAVLVDCVAVIHFSFLEGTLKLSNAMPFVTLHAHKIAGWRVGTSFFLFFLSDNYSCFLPLLNHTSLGMERITLRKRITHSYVGDYSHLDQWEEIGTATIMEKSDFYDESDEENHDGCMSHFRLVKVEVEKGSGHGEETISTALADSFSFGGCACSHDCCGCRTGHVTQAERCQLLNYGHNGEPYQVWMVLIHSSQNY